MRDVKRKTPFSKRLLDIIMSAIILILASPFLLLTAVLIFLSYGAPIFFTHERPGKGGQPFKLIKFRSMRDARDQEGNILPDAERITRFGQFIRRTSIDELPEFYNVLRGDMSLVGPRPLLMQYLQRYSAEQARRHDVLPGVTGWAQINGRNAISWDDKFKYDLWYIDHWTFWLDIKIIFLTIWKVLKGDGISQPGRATMDEFMGNSDD
jgi:lipopolysaccharide/colanic/teichoic acid biosynthesis glycosyltransferase